MLSLRTLAHALATGSALALMACTGSSPATLPGAEVAAASDIGATRTAIHYLDNGVVAGTSAMGVYALVISEGTAWLEPAARSVTLTGAKFEADLTAAMSGEILTRCPDCFKVTGFRPAGEGKLAIGFQLRHPIPAPNGTSPIGSVLNRNDLHVTNVRLVALVDGTTEMFLPAQRVVVNMDQITNADGYTAIDPVAELPPIYAANVFPFITLGDHNPSNNGTGNFKPGLGEGAGWEDVQSADPETSFEYPRGFNVLPQGGTIEDELIFDLSQGASGDFRTNLVILASYIGAADGRPTRLASRYFMPEGAIQQSPNIQLAFEPPPAAEAGSFGTLVARIVDFQQNAVINSDPVQALTTRDYSKVWADGRIDLATPTVGEYIGGVNNFLQQTAGPSSKARDIIDAAPGTGSYADPKVLTWDFENVFGFTGILRAGVTVFDSRYSAPLLDVPAAGADPLNPNVFESITGLREDLDVFNPASVVSAQKLLVTYQFASIAITADPVDPQGIFIPDTPGRANPDLTNDFFRNGMVAIGNDIYACFYWPGNDDTALFVARSADGGVTWGAPVQVPADGIANTLFSGRGASLVDVGGVPGLVTIDTEEDVVFLRGANSGTNSTTWPSGLSNRVVVVPLGTGRNFNVSASGDPAAPGTIHVGINRRETQPATSNEVQYYLVEGALSNSPTARKATEANGGVIDNGPDAAASRFDVDVAKGAAGPVQFLWKDAGDNALEYRTVQGAVVSPISSPFPGKFLPGLVRPNLAVSPTGQPFVVIDFPSDTILSDGGTDRDVFIVTRNGSDWSAPLLVNTDALELEEKEAEVAVLNTGGGNIRIAVCYEADLGANARRIFVALMDPDLSPGSVVRHQLTPDPTDGQDRLDPKVAGNAAGQAVVTWEAKRDGAAGQSAVR